MNLRRSPNDLITLHFYPKGMAPKGVGAPAERGDRLRLRHLRHHSLREEVVATNIGQWDDQYWSMRELL